MNRSASKRPARRPRGEGTVYYDEGRDRWIGAITIAGRRRKVTGKDKTEARARLAELLAAKTTGAAVPNKRITVAQALDAWLERGLPDRTRAGRPIAPSTVALHEWAARQLRDELGTVRLVELDVHAVELALDRLRTGDPPRPMSRASQRRVLSTLQLVLDNAERRGDVVGNVARKATTSPSAPARSPRRALTPDEARTLLQALRDERNGAMFGLSLLVGLRPGEAAALHWADMVDDTVNVTRGLRVIGGRPEIVDDLKTEASKRTIQMPPALTEWLAQHRAAQVAERLAAQSWADDRLVFATSAGTVVAPRNARRQLEAVCERAGVPVVRPNELRHSCASLLSDEGVPNESIADLLGHTTTRMVDQTYRHRLRPVVDVAAQASWIARKG